MEIPIEELEDQFLRLKEVLNCGVNIFEFPKLNTNSIYEIYVDINEFPLTYEYYNESVSYTIKSKIIIEDPLMLKKRTSEKLEEIRKELNQIKLRIKSIYNLSADINEGEFVFLISLF